jgi:hypothetical protein
MVLRLFFNSLGAQECSSPSSGGAQNRLQTGRWRRARKALFVASPMSMVTMRLILRIGGLIMIMRTAGGEQCARKKN